MQSGQKIKIESKAEQRQALTMNVSVVKKKKEVKEKLREEY